LHRNAVSYRINQVFSLLDVDPENPDDRLLLQLACRARDMAH
jgi:DNA-binding PucR family transcriptional regulator